MSMFEVPIDLKSLENSIIAYEQEPIEKGKILFYGHSIFTRWGSPKYGFRRMDEDIRMKDGSLAVVNHGFGTSTSEELLYYYPRMVRPWEPRALVLMTLANDGMYGMGVEQTLNNLFKICHWARTDFPDIKIFLVEPHPNPKGSASTLPDKWNSAFHRRDHFIQAINLYAQTHENTEVIHLWDKPGFFLTPEDVGDPHKVREDIFAPDKVHLNQAGYDIFGPIIREALDDLL